MLYSLKLICVHLLNLPVFCIFKLLMQERQCLQIKSFRTLRQELDRDTPGLQSLQSHSLATGSCKSCCGIKGPWSLCLATQKDLPWHLLYCPDKQGNCALGWDCLLVPLSPFKSLFLLGRPSSIIFFLFFKIPCRVFFLDLPGQDGKSFFCVRGVSVFL